MSAPTENHAGAAEQIEEGFRVYIGNLPYSATEEQIRELITSTGTQPTSVSLPMKFNRPSGFAFVAYENEQDAKKVVDQLNGHEMGERKLLFEVARTKQEAQEARKAVQEKRNAAKAAKAAEKKANREAAATEAGAAPADGESKPASRPKKARAPRRRVPEEGDEAEEEEAAPGAADATKPKKKRNRKPKGAAAAGAETGAAEGRIDAAEENGQVGSAEEKKEKPKREKKPRAKLVLTGEQSKSTIFVANLPFSVDDEALASIFTNLSIAVKSAMVVRGTRKGRDGARPFRASKGFGFVEVEDPAQQAEAVKKVDGSLIGDRQISARVAHEMKPAEKEAVAEAEQQQAGEATA